MVEDNPGDVFLFQEGLRESGSPVEVLVASEVDQGIRLLHPDNVPVPCLVIVDLHLPKRDGKHLLEFLRDQAHLIHMPAVVMSSTQRESDRQTCLSLGAREVLTKPSDWKGYCALVRNLGHYWNSSNKPPER